METMFVRIKPRDPRRKFVLRRFTYAGVLFHEERGFYRVPREVADYLKGVRQTEFNPYSPPAFDVCTEEEARVLLAAEQEQAGGRRGGLDALPVTVPRDAPGTVTTRDLPQAEAEDPARPARGRGRPDARK